MFPLASSSAAPSGARPLVVVIDDDLAVVSSFYDASAFLAQDRPEAGCLVIDYNLPGMSGTDLLDELERRGPLPPFVLIASNPDRRCRRWVDEHGATMVEKPLLGAALTRMVWAAMRQTAH